MKTIEIWTQKPREITADDPIQEHMEIMAAAQLDVQDRENFIQKTLRSRLYYKRNRLYSSQKELYML